MITVRRWLEVLLAVGLATVGTTSNAQSLATDPLVRQMTDRSNWEPGGRYFGFNDRGSVTQRSGQINTTITSAIRMGNLSLQSAVISGHISYVNSFSGHGWEQHAPFDNVASQSDSVTNQRADGSSTSVSLGWTGTENHPANGYDGPQGGGYPAPAGARDIYSYSISGSAFGTYLLSSTETQAQDTAPLYKGSTSAIPFGSDSYGSLSTIGYQYTPYGWQSVLGNPFGYGASPIYNRASFVPQRASTLQGLPSSYELTGFWPSLGNALIGNVSSQQAENAAEAYLVRSLSQNQYSPSDSWSTRLTKSLSWGLDVVIASSGAMTYEATKAADGIFIASGIGGAAKYAGTRYIAEQGAKTAVKEATNLRSAFAEASKSNLTNTFNSATQSVGNVVENISTKILNLTAEQAKNVSRFEKKLPVNAKDSVSIRPLPNEGVAVQGISPGRVPGSSAVYEKQIDAAGKTIQATKTTYDPAGNIVHVKDKITGEIFP